jgi:hypothetical protein
LFVCFGFFLYLTFLKTRSTGQHPAALKTSLAELSSFALELTKKMNMRYIKPPLPVNLSVIQREGENIDMAMAMNLLNTASGAANQERGVGDENMSHVSHDDTDYAAVAALFDKK